MGVFGGRENKVFGDRGNGTSGWVGGGNVIHNVGDLMGPTHMSIVGRGYSRRLLVSLRRKRVKK